MIKIEKIYANRNTAYRIFTVLGLLTLVACSGGGEPAASVADANACGTNGGSGNPACCKNPSKCAQSNFQTASALKGAAADLNNAAGLLAQLDSLNGNDKLGAQGFDPNAQFLKAGGLAEGTGGKGFLTAPPTANLGLDNLLNDGGKNSGGVAGGGAGAAGSKLGIAPNTETHVAQPASLLMSENAGLKSYSGGGGAASAGPKRGSGAGAFADAGHGSFANESFGVATDAERSIAQIQDPADYFTRTDQNDNLFRLVSRIYSKVSLNWEKEKADQLRRAR